MLVVPNTFYNLFSPSQRKGNDLEKSGESHVSTPQGGKGDTYFHHSPQHRPAELDLQSEQLEDAQDPKNPTKTYRIMPIFSGIMVPFSIMLSIPSLTGHWYIRTGDNGVLLETRANPPLLDAAMGLSMGCGILASACLVIRFAERQIKFMTFMCIVFLTLHDLINIPAVTIFGVEHRFEDGFTYGQSFWFTVCSTIASTATNITLLTDYNQTKDFNHSGSGLTHKQRSLVIIVIILLCYVSIGSLLLAIMLKMSFIDALYLSVVSIETIGFGDLHPDSTGTRIFACCYIAGGILNLALAVALSREALLESAAVGFRSRIRAAEARQRERHIRTRWRAAVRWRLRAEGHPMWVDDRDEERRGRVGKRRHHHHWYSSIRRMWRKLFDEVWREWEDPAWRYVYGPNHKRLNLEALTESQLETAALEAGAPLAELIPKGYKLRSTRRRSEDEGNGMPPNAFFPRVDSMSSVNAPPLTYVRMGGMVSLLAKFAIAMAHGLDDEPETSGHTIDDHEVHEHPNTSGDLEEIVPPLTIGRTGIPFTRTMTMTTIPPEDETTLAESLEQEEKNAFRARLTVALALFFVFWTAGSAIFMKTEKWAFGNAAYFCFVSFTTVGYGDFAPKTPAGRSIFVVWAMLGVGTMTILISILAEAYSTQYKSIIKSEVLKSESTTGIDTARGYDSRTMLNTVSDPDPYRPQFSPPTAWSSTPISIPSSTLRLGRGPTLQKIPSVPELQLKIGTTPQQRVSRERLQALPQQVLDHAQAVRSLLAAITVDETAGNSQSDLAQTDRTMEALMFEIERSLQGVTNAARDIISTSDITKHHQ